MWVGGWVGGFVGVLVGFWGFRGVGRGVLAWLAGPSHARPGTRYRNPNAPTYIQSNPIDPHLCPVQEAEARWAARCRALEEEVELGRRERASLALAAEQARREVRGGGTHQAECPP